MKTVTILLALMVAAGFAGALHPAGDSLGVFRVPLLVLLALAAIWSPWPRRLRWPVVAFCLALLVPHALARPLTPQPAGPDITLYQQNLWYKRTESQAWLDAIRQAPPDILTLQEVSTGNVALLDALSDLYPSRVHCPIGPKVGEAILTRFAMVPGSAHCAARDGFAAMQVDTPHGRIWLVSLHLYWPWPRGQADQVTALLPQLEKLDGPVILGGDFNAVGWSHTLARIEAATGTRRIGPWTLTFDLPVVGLPIGIDHVLTSAASGAQGIEVRPGLGSDHRGLFARLGRPEVAAR